MKFGLFYELQLPTPWEDGDENRIFREALEHVQLAEQLGFEHMWAVEHHFLDDHSISSSPETWLAAAAASLRVVRVRMGSGGSNRVTTDARIETQTYLQCGPGHTMAEVLATPRRRRR